MTNNVQNSSVEWSVTPLSAKALKAGSGLSIQLPPIPSEDQYREVYTPWSLPCNPAPERTPSLLPAYYDIRAQIQRYVAQNSVGLSDAEILQLTSKLYKSRDFEEAYLMLKQYQDLYEKGGPSLQNQYTDLRKKRIVPESFLDPQYLAQKVNAFFQKVKASKTSRQQ